MAEHAHSTCSQEGKPEGGGDVGRWALKDASTKEKGGEGRKDILSKGQNEQKEHKEMQMCSLFKK